jgi:hypothetical protein
MWPFFVFFRKGHRAHGDKKSTTSVSKVIIQRDWTEHKDIQGFLKGFECEEREEGEHREMR